jgi:hypothetical protein
MKKRTQLSSRELQILSACLDGELSKKDQKRVERLLSDHPTAISSLENLRQVKKVIKLLPIRKVPRNFTILAEEVNRSMIPGMAGVLRYASAVSAALLAVVLAFDFISPYQLAAGELGFVRSAVKKTFEEKITTSVEEEASINIWQPTAPFADDGYGIGGRGGGTDDLDFQNEITLPDVVIAPGDDQIEEIPSVAQEGTTTETDQLPQVVGEQTQADGEKSIQESKSSEEESGLISGIRPSGSQGTIGLFDKISDAVVEVSEMTPLCLIEIVLAGLTIATALLASFLHKCKK